MVGAGSGHGCVHFRDFLLIKLSSSLILWRVAKYCSEITNSLYNLFLHKKWVVAFDSYSGYARKCSSCSWLLHLSAASLLMHMILVCYTAVFSVVTQRSSPQWGGTLHDDSKNGCVADYMISYSL